MEEVLEGGNVVGTLEFAVQLDFFVSEYASELILRLRLLSALTLVLAEQLEAAELLQVIEVKGFLLGL